MRAIVVATALALLTIGLVIFIFADLHAAKTPPSSPTAVDASLVTPAPPPAPVPSQPTAVTPAAVVPVVPARTVTAPAATAPSSQLLDPLDQLIQGKTRREWRAIYAAKQKRILSDIERYIPIIERAEAGEEPDPTQLGEAHTRVRELKDDLRRDQEELQRIEATSPDP